MARERGDGWEIDWGEVFIDSWRVGGGGVTRLFDFERKAHGILHTSSMRACRHKFQGNVVC